MPYLKPAKLANFLFAKCLFGASLTALSTQALASGFMLHEASASLLGEFYAGNASVAEDASTNYFNSAGLTHLKKLNLSASGINVSTYADYNGTVAYKTGGIYKETGTAKLGAGRLVPALHLASSFSEKWAVGFSASAPWGLATEYPVTSVARYQNTHSELKTINLSPSVAFAPWKWLSFGAGFDALYARAELDGVIGNGFTTSSDTQLKNNANGWGYGWHVGALTSFDKTGTKIGANFRSQLNAHLKGTSKLEGPLNLTGAVSDNLKADLKLPWFIDASITQEVLTDFTLLATVEYIQWSIVDQLKLTGVQTPLTGQVTTVNPLDYQNSWTYLLAARYYMNDSVMFKVGGGYDQTPTTSPDRTLSIPDANRWSASGGVRWFPMSAKNVFVDVGYAHLFIDTAQINKTIVSGTQTINENGNVKGGANLFGVQISVLS